MATDAPRTAPDTTSSAEDRTPAQPAAGPCDGADTNPWPDVSWKFPGGGREFRYLEDRAAGLLYASPMPTAEELARLYEEHYDYEWFRRRACLKLVQAAHRYLRVAAAAREHRRSPGRTLCDVGSGHGWFARIAAAAGWEAIAVDRMDLGRAEALRRAGVTAHADTFDAAAIDDESIDVVTLWHALEHMPDPTATLAKVGRILRPGGICFIAVPNRDALGLRREGVDWGWLQEPFVHPWCFSARAIRRMAPPSVEVVWETSRDTWDQQVAFSTSGYGAFDWIERKTLGTMEQLARGLGRIPGAAAIQARVVAREAVHVATYAAYLGVRPLFRERYEDALRGSELNVVLRRRFG